MKPRTSPLPVFPAGSPRYWTENLPEPLGETLFKVPVLSLASLVHLVVSENQLSSIGLVIGSAWSHKEFELSSGSPPMKKDSEKLLEYGNSVLDELQDYLSVEDIMKLGKVIGDKFKMAIPSQEKVEEKKDFFSPKEDSKSA